MIRAMATPWDRADKGYVDEWVPRFVPYHLDLIREAKILPGHRVLVACAGSGPEVLAAARAVGEHGRVRATDPTPELIKLCAEQVEAARFSNVTCGVAHPSDTTGGPWDVLLCAFALWQMTDRAHVLKAWRQSLAPSGKLGIVTWGPLEEDDPFERMNRCLQYLEPDYSRPPSPRILSERDSMAQMFEEAGLVMVRHTVVRHTMSFRSAEVFVHALREAHTWRTIWEDLGEARVARVAARFYGLSGGPDAPLSWDPPATVAVAAVPGAEIELEHRPSVRVPTMKPPE